MKTRVKGGYEKLATDYLLKNLNCMRKTGKLKFVNNVRINANVNKEGWKKKVLKKIVKYLQKTRISERNGEFSSVQEQICL